MNWKHLSCALEGLHNKYEKINTLQTITSLLAFHPFFHFTTFFSLCCSLKCDCCSKFSTSFFVAFFSDSFTLVQASMKIL